MRHSRCVTYANEDFKLLMYTNEKLNDNEISLNYSLL